MQKGIEKSKEAALHFIDTKLQSTDEVGVLSYSVIHGLVLHEFLTTNHKKVREVIEGFGTKNIVGRAYNVESIYWKMVEGEEYPLADFSKQFSLGQRQVGFDRRVYKEQASNFALKLEELSKAFRYIPGNKYIIFFSSGIASSVMYGKSSFLKNYDFVLITDEAGLGESVIRNRYEGMLKELSASNCTVYTMNVEELEALIRQDADTLGTTSLKRLAKKTGGKYYESVHNYENIMEELQNLTSSYYVLGYYINEKWDGKYHKIEVKVKKNGYEIHAQGGYYNPKPFSEYSKLEKQIHLVDLALTERPLFQDPIRFPLGAVLKPGEKKANLHLIFEIPAEKLAEISGQKVEIVSLVFNKKDDIVAFDRVEKNLSILPEKELQYTSKLTIHPGEYKCRVVIRNLETGKGAVGSASITIPAG